MEGYRDALHGGRDGLSERGRELGFTHFAHSVSPILPIFTCLLFFFFLGFVGLLGFGFCLVCRFVVASPIARAGENPFAIHLVLTFTFVTFES